MAQTSSIDSHPQRSKILAGIIANKPLRTIAASVSPPVSVSAIQRYKRGPFAKAVRLGVAELQPGDSKVASTGQSAVDLVQLDKDATGLAQVFSAAADPVTRELLKEANRNRDALARAIQAAEAAEDPKGVASAAKVDLDRVDHLARLAGVGASAQQQQASGPVITIIMPTVAGAQPAEDLEIIDAQVIDAEE